MGQEHTPAQHSSGCPREQSREIAAKVDSHVRSPLTMGDFAHIEENFEVFRYCVKWINQYLARPHRDLGRTGNVCPFARPAIARDSLRIAVVRLTDQSRKKSQILDAIISYRETFLSFGAARENEMLQAILVLFPDVQLDEAVELIDGTKEELKASFVERGLMLGEFHANNESPGLHNHSFRPLRSEIPMLAIRRMVATDHVFLNRTDYDPATRLQYIETYLRASPTGDPTVRQEMERIIATLRSQVPEA